MFVGAAWFDHHWLLTQEAEDVQRTVAVLREHALKAIETQELLLRQLDLRTMKMSWDEIRARAAALSDEMRAMHTDLPQVSALGLSDADGKQWASSVPLPAIGYFSVTNREFWLAQQEADQGTFISRSYIGNQTKRFNFGISL